MGSGAWAGVHPQSARLAPALLCALCALLGAAGQHHDTNVTMKKHCNDLANDVWKVCKVQKQKELCSQECDAMLKTAAVHQAICDPVIVSASETYGDTIRSHANFRAHYCTQDTAARGHHQARVATAMDKEKVQECYTRSDREDYRGHVNTTIGGYRCQKWSEQRPHHHPHVPTEENAWQGIGDHNYCRSLSWDSCAWCYTVEQHPKWECCLIGAPQPTCPSIGSATALPAALSESHRKVFDDLVAGNCPRMLIMIKLVAMTLATQASRTGWYEVVSEQSKGIGEGEAFLVAGHHNTLPGQTVADEMRGRLNVQDDGVLRCTDSGLYFEARTPGAATSTPVAGLPRRVHVHSMQVPELNATIIELIEFKPVEADDGDSDASDKHEDALLPWWRHQSQRFYVLVGLGVYVGSMAICALLSYLIGKARTGSAPSPATFQRRGSLGNSRSRGPLSCSPSALPSAHPSAHPSVHPSLHHTRVPSALPSPSPRMTGYDDPRALPRDQRWRPMKGSALRESGGSFPPTSPSAVQTLPIDQAINLRRVHDMAATTIQRQARERGMTGAGESGVFDAARAEARAHLQAERPHAYGHPGALHDSGALSKQLPADYDPRYAPNYASQVYAPRKAGYGADDRESAVGGAGDGPGDPGLGEGEVKRLLVPFFRSLGLHVARNPWRTIGLSIVFAAVCTSGLWWMKFEASSFILYLPQKSEMALTRKRYADNFGILPDTLMMVIKRRAGGSIINKASLSSALALYQEVTEIRAEQPTALATPVTSGYSRGHQQPADTVAAAYQPIVLSDFCVRRYVHQLGDYTCAVSSLLELWQYSQRQLDQDVDVQATVFDAHMRKEVDLGLVETDNRTRSIACNAFMLTLFFNATAEAFNDGRYKLWHHQLRERLPLIAQRESLDVTWWSTRLNEEESSSFVHKDAPLLSFAFVFVIIYVAVSLSDIRCSDEQSAPSPGGGGGVRLMLSLSCALCSALSMSSGFGLTSIVGTPISPVTPVVSFTLLGVSVDNMIIIVDTFDRTSEALDVAVRLSHSIAEAGTAITVTTFTTLVAFLTGLWVDLPVYSYFCTAAACCVGCLYILQLTLFCALLVVDTQSRIAAARAYEGQSPALDAEEEAYGDGEGLYDDPAGDHLLPASYLGSEHTAHVAGGAYGYGAGAGGLGAGGAYGSYGHNTVDGCRGMETSVRNGGRGEGVHQCGARNGPGGCGGGYDAYGGFTYPRLQDPFQEVPPAQAVAAQLPSNAYAAQCAYADTDADGTEWGAGANGGPVNGEGAGEGAAGEAPRHLNHLRVPGDPGYTAHNHDHAYEYAEWREGSDPADRAAADAGSGPPGGPHKGGGGGSAGTAHPFAPESLDSRQTAMLSYAKLLLSPAVKLLVIFLYLAPVVFAVFVVQDIKPGLPYRQTVPEDSIIMNFLDDVDQYYGGSFPVKVVMVFEDTDVTDVNQVEGVEKVVAKFLMKPYVNRVASDWLADYREWTGCYKDEAAAYSWCTLQEFLGDGEFNICAAGTDSANSTRRALLADGPEAGAGVGAGAAPPPRQSWALQRQHGSGSTATEWLGALCGSDSSGDCSTAAAPAVETRRRLRHRHRRGEGDVDEGGDGDDDDDDDDDGEEDCFNDEAGFTKLSAGHVCDEAVSRCESGTGWRVVRKYCPVTCGVCTPSPTAAAGVAKRQQQHNETSGDSEDKSVIFGGKVHENDVVLRELVPGGCATGAARDESPACASPRGCTIGSHRIILSTILPQNMQQSFFVWQDMMSVFDEVSEELGHQVTGYVYHVRFEFGTFDHSVIQVGLKNLGVVVIVIAVCTLCFLPFFISLLAVFSVVCIDLQLLSVMSLAGLNFNSISCISLLIALGLAIDYSVHLGHAYNNAPFDDRQTKVIHALVTMGSSILNAGGSTLLGTLFLAASDSIVFRTFFIFMWGTIFLGLFSGLAFAPVVLSLIGPLERRHVHAHGQGSPQARQDGNGKNRVGASADDPAGHTMHIR